MTKGLYSVLLGDTTLTNTDVRLRVWFNDGTNGQTRTVTDPDGTAARKFYRVQVSYP